MSEQQIKGRFGLEIEIIPAELPKLSPTQKKHITQLKERVFAHAASNPEKSSKVKEFTPEQLMMYELHEIEPATKDILEYLFGTGREDSSYYDAVIGAMRCLEVKLKPVTAPELLKNLATFTKTFAEKTKNYGIKTTEPKVQLNISFWNDGGNLFDPYNAEFKSSGAQIIAGILEEIFAQAPNMKFLYKSATGAPTLISLSIGREGFSRLVGEGEKARLELRLSRCGATLPEMDLDYLINQAVIPGAVAGRGADLLVKKPRGIFERAGSNFKIILHVLQGSEIKRTWNPFIHRLLPPENYIAGWLYLNYAKIVMELGKEPISPTIPIEALKFLDEKKYPELIKEYKATTDKRLEYFRTLSAKENRNPLEELEYKFLRTCERGDKMIWPDNHYFNQHFTAQAATSMTLEQLLQFFRDIKIKKSGKQYKIIWPEKTTLFGKEIPLNVTQLSKQISCLGFVETFTMERRELK